MNKSFLILSAVILFFTAKLNAQTICDSISVDTVFVDGNLLHITVYNSSHHFIAYPFFFASLTGNSFISINDSLAIPTFLSIPGDGSDGYTTATYIDVSIAPAANVPQNTLFTGTVTIQDPNDSTFSCSKSFSFLYDEMMSSVNEVENDIMKLYPNPTSGQFTLLLTTDDAEINVTDLLGRQIINKQLTQKTTNISLEHSGLYWVYVKSGQGTRTMKLIVTQ